MKNYCDVCNSTEQETKLVKCRNEQHNFDDYKQACETCISTNNLHIVTDTEEEARRLTEKFISNLKVNQRYSTGFQVLMKIEELVYDKQTNKLVKFKASDNEEEDEYYISTEDIYKNMKHQLDKGSFIYIPILVDEVSDEQ